MTITLLLLALAVLFLLFVLWYAPWRHGGEFTRALEPISMPALMNLLDAKNVEFLQRSLSPTEFRSAMRERNRTLRVYVRRISHNTKVLISEGAVAQRSGDAAIAQSGRVLIEAALATRARALRALAYLYVGELFPGLVPDLTAAVTTYQSATQRMDSLRSLHAAQ